MNQDFKILIVDDDEVTIELLLSNLESLGHKNVFAALNGADALKTFMKNDHSDPVNLIFLDLKMPKMDGVEFLRHISEIGYTGFIVIISSQDRALLNSVKNLAHSRNLSIVDVLSKPIPITALKLLFKKITEMPLPDAAPNPQGINAVHLEDLRECLANNQLVIYYQPKIKLEDNSLYGVEALSRWFHPTLGEILPSVFIPLAEENNLINLLTYELIQEVVMQLASWHKAKLDVKASLNLSAINLRQLDLPEYIESVCAVNHLDMSSLMLEVTESKLMDDLPNMVETLTRLRLKGVELSIDDFGTGYASMEQLDRLPFSELKIEKQFVHDLDQNPKHRAILESSISLARSLGMTTVAEGVESKRDHDLMKALGIDVAQGNYYAKPLSGSDLLQWALSRNLEH